MFIEATWQEAVISLLTAINILIGEPGYTSLKEPLTMKTIIEIGGSLQNSSYQPSQWFNLNTGSYRASVIVAHTPKISTAPVPKVPIA